MASPAPKHLVWIPNHDLGYVIANYIENQGEDDVVVSLDSGELRAISKNLFQKVNPTNNTINPGLTKLRT